MQLRKAKPAEKEYALPDGGGLHLNVSTTGFRPRLLKCRFGKKEKLLTIGSYPEISLLETCDAAKKLVKKTPV